MKQVCIPCLWWYDADVNLCSLTKTVASVKMLQFATTLKGTIWIFWLFESRLDFYSNEPLAIYISHNWIMIIKGKTSLCIFDLKKCSLGKFRRSFKNSSACHKKEFSVLWKQTIDSKFQNFNPKIFHFWCQKTECHNNTWSLLSHVNDTYFGNKTVAHLVTLQS